MKQGKACNPRVNRVGGTTSLLGTGIGFLIMVLWVPGCLSTSSVSLGQADCERTRSFYVLSHGWHTGIALATPDLLQVLPGLKERFGEGAFIEVGWGDEAFYRAPEPDWALALRAMLWPTSTVVQVVKVANNPETRFPYSDIIEITVTETGYRRLINFIAETFVRSSQGALQPIEPGAYDDSWFYRAQGSYFAFYTCNTWVAEAVEISGFPISSILALTAEDVMSRLRGAATAAAACVEKESV